MTAGVSWRRALAVLAVTAALATTIVVTLRADGFEPVEATAPRATRWFVHQATGRAVLADGFAGRALARLEVTADGSVLEIAQSPSGAAVVDRSAATARSIDTAELRLGPPRPVEIVARPDAIVAVGQTGLLAVDPPSAEALLLPPGGDPVPFELGAAGDETRIAPDGSVWTIAAGALSRITSTGRVTLGSGLSDARFTLVGSVPLLFDVARARVRLGDGAWFGLPDDVPPSEVVLQEPGPRGDCGWVGADDRLWCVDAGGDATEVTVDGLDIDGADRLAIAGDAAVLVRRNGPQIVRLDWRTGEVLEEESASVSPGSQLAIAVSTDLVWVDDQAGDVVWAINPWGLHAISKDDDGSPLLGEAGDVVEPGRSDASGGVVIGDELTFDRIPEPDDNGIDDPPVAVPDAVTARTGSPVLIAVTANDFDPDGEAIAVVEVSDPDNGTAEIQTASNVVYQPSAAFVGVDQFEYTIVDGSGTEASATVTVELLPVDATNQAPVGARDVAETGLDTPVIVEVLLNDVDPERDPLRIDSFSAPDVGGVVTETVGPSGLAALRYQPAPGASGTATFSYRPADALGAVGEPVAVQVEIAQSTDANREPIVRPDAVRLRRDVPTELPVLANDRDPDGDRLLLGLVEPLPPGLDVQVEGDRLVIVARAGARPYTPFAYTVDDGHGHVVTGRVLVVVISDVEPNRPPVANADTATAVEGATQLFDVLVNDTDPDGDKLVLVGVERAESSTADVRVQGDRIRYTAASTPREDDVVLDRFTYEISDGRGHRAFGEVTVRVLPERVAAPPFTQDDAATTIVDVPVTLDVLRNDGDPSGERPTIVGTPGCAGGGSATVTGDSRVTYRPPRGATGVFTCTYEVANSQGLRAGATIVISVLPPPVSNVAPVVTGEERTVEVGETVEVDVLDNDIDPDGPRSELRVVASTTPSSGRATRNGSVIVFEAGPVPEVVVIGYQVSDANGGVSAGRLLIRVVEPIPEPPLTTDDRRTITGPGVPTTIDVLANDTDPDGDRATLRIASAQLVSGDATIEVGARTITFVPNPSYVGDIVASYVVADLDGLTATGRAILTVLEAPNRPPVAAGDTAQVVGGSSVTVRIALNDSDPDGDPLTYTIVTPPDPALGAARLSSGALVFDSVFGAVGVATVVYRVDDGEATADATVLIDVLPCTAATPEAPDLFFETGYQQPISIDLRKFARNGEVVSAGPPLGAPSGVYTPPAGENGNISFAYTVRNACRIQAVGTVTIDVNQDPVATPFVRSIGRIDPVVFPVSELATDDEPLVIVALEAAPDWITVVDEQRALQVVPGGRTGRVDLAAVVADPGGLQARVPITIELVNRAPIANPDAVAADAGAVVIEPLANDVDPDGDAVTLGSVPETFQFPDGSTGTIQQLGDGRLRIDPGVGRGTATFAYTVVDSLGAVSAPAVVTVVVNRLPVASVTPISVPDGGSVTAAVIASDPDGDPLVLSILGDPAPLTITVDGLMVTVTAPAGSSGAVVTVRYRVTDPRGGSAESDLEITVTPPPTTTTTSTTTTVPPTTTTTTSTTTTPGTSTTTTTSVP